MLDLVGLDEARFRPIGGFSTGMRQRAKLAQAIVADPELVLLDEPTAGLDPTGREEMLALVARLGTFGISVLLATHLLDDVQQVCDHVVMLDARAPRGGRPDQPCSSGPAWLSVDVADRDGLTRAGRPRPGRQEVDGLVEVESTATPPRPRARRRRRLGLPLHRMTTRPVARRGVRQRGATEAAQERAS